MATTQQATAPQSITFSPSDIDQSGDQHSKTPAPKPVPNAAPVTFSPTDIDHEATAKAKALAASPAAQPGAYQQSKGGPVHNAVEEAKNPFTDSVTSILPKSWGGQTGAMMKREDESDSQFFARAVEAGRHVNAEQIEEETKANKKAVLPTLGAAALAGPAMLTAETGAAAPFVASSTPALAITGEATGEMIAGPSLARMGLTLGAQGSKAAIQWIAANPVKAYLLYKTASELGIGPSKLLKLFHVVGSGAE